MIKNIENILSIKVNTIIWLLTMEFLNERSMYGHFKIGTKKPAKIIQ
jgi:hypothetical protein